MDYFSHSVKTLRGDGVGSKQEDAVGMYRVKQVGDGVGVAKIRRVESDLVLGVGEVATVVAH